MNYLNNDNSSAHMTSKVKKGGFNMKCFKYGKMQTLVEYKDFVIVFELKQSTYCSRECLCVLRIIHLAMHQRKYTLNVLYIIKHHSTFLGRFLLKFFFNKVHCIRLTFEFLEKLTLHSLHTTPSPKPPNLYQDKGIIEGKVPASLNLTFWVESET